MKVEIYTRDECWYCSAAKDLLREKGLEYVENHIPTTITRDKVKELFPEAKTLPIILVDNQWIGGYTELQQVLGGN